MDQWVFNGRRNDLDSQLDRFRKMHSEIIENYQCIEYDMRRIYSAMVDGDYDDSMDELWDKNWGVLLFKLKKLDNSDGNPFISEKDYDLLDEIRERRNYWCHQCYLDFVYFEDDEYCAKLLKMLRKVENELNRTKKIQRSLEKIYLQYFC